MSGKAKGPLCVLCGKPVPIRAIRCLFCLRIVCLDCPCDCSGAREHRDLVAAYQEEVYEGKHR